jgi:hypothetical protein
MPDKPVPLRLVRLQVHSILHGVPPHQNEIEVGTGRGGGDCGYLFETGKEYVVYAYWNKDGWFETSICSGTRTIVQGGEDLAYFRAMEHAPETGNLKVRAALNPPFEKGQLTISVEQNGVRRRAVVDTRGEASFPDLPSGAYTLHIDQDGDMPDDPVVNVRPKGCLDAYFPRTPRITGRVLAKSGIPVANVEVQLLAPPGDFLPSAMTDSEGHFELRIVTPGTYALGVNLTRAPSHGSPYPRWFHPGTSDPAAATRISFSGGREVRSLDLTLPDRLRDRTINVLVVDADGTPNGNAEVRVLTGSQTMAVAAGAGGRLAIPLLSGTRYRVYAISRGLRGEPTLSAEPADIEPGTESINLVLRLTRPGDTQFEEFLRGIKSAW